MIALATGTALLIALLALAAFVVIVVAWRVVVHDRAVRRIRLGVFFERERDDDDGPPTGAPRG